MLWRTLFILYAIVLTVSTHWPRLDLGRGGGDRSPDKILHFMAFAALALALWRTKWICSKWLVVLLALAWLSLDELSQLIAIVGRTASWLDWLAGTAGVLTVGAWLWALSPVGGPLNRLRLARSRSATDAVLDHVPTLAWISLGGLIGAAAGVAVVFAAHLLGHVPQLDSTLLTVFAGAGAGSHWVYVLLHRRETARIIATHTCFSCGHAIEPVTCNADGKGACPSCAEPFHIGQWLPEVLPSIAAPLRLTIMPAMIAVLLIFGGGLVVFLIAELTIDVPGVRRTIRALTSNEELTLVADVAYVLIAMAISVRWFRAKLAPFYDNQGGICLQCKHDLRGTPTDFTIGTCGECGTKFMRMAEGIDSP